MCKRDVNGIYEKSGLEGVIDCTEEMTIIHTCRVDSELKYLIFSFRMYKHILMDSFFHMFSCWQSEK